MEGTLVWVVFARMAEKTPKVTESISTAVTLGPVEGEDSAAFWRAVMAVLYVERSADIASQSMARRLCYRRWCHH